MTKRGQAFRVIAGNGFVLAWAGIISRGGDRWMIPAVFYYATPWLLRLLAALVALAAFRHWGLQAN